MIYNNQARLDHIVSLIMYWTKIQTFLVRFEAFMPTDLREAKNKIYFILYIKIYLLRKRSVYYLLVCPLTF